MSFTTLSAAEKPADTAPMVPTTDSKRILIIYSEGKDLPGNVALDQALRGEVTRLMERPVEFYSEYLDANRFADEAHYEIFRNYLSAKYARQDLDLLVIVMARDYSLAKRLPSQLFPGLPIVFLCFSELNMPPELERPGVSGLIQQLDARDTIDLIVRLQPDLDRLVVIGGKSETDQRTLARIADAAQTYPDLQLDLWTNRLIKNLSAETAALTPGTVVLLSTMFEDAAGQTLYMSTAARSLAPTASVPIYVMGSGGIGVGAVGGVVIEPTGLGKRAAELAVQTLQSGAAKAAHIERHTNVVTMVDWRALQRWQIPASRLPPKSAVLYRPTSLWEERRRLILTVLGVLLAQAFTIAGLLFERSHRRRVEAQVLRQQAELAHVSRVSTMGQLASALAHEINQPLGAILRNTEAAEIYLQRENPDLNELKAILADIRKDDQRAGAVIDKTRSLMKRKSMELRTLDSRELLQETITLADSDARARHVELSLDAPAGLPPIRGDRVHLQQVLLNLILNGMDAMSANSNVAKRVVVRGRATGEGGLEVSVSDTGPGLPRDRINRVFDAFFTTKPNGLGMGLAISRTIIEAHGGTIRAENNPDFGANFLFTLPPNKA